MKKQRHELILKLIAENNIATQEQLQRLLQSKGCQVTQATLSRDIRELSLVKTPSSDGGYRYSVPALHADFSNQEKKALYNFLTDAVISADHAANIVAVKCRTGMAQAVCAQLDGTGIENVVGTIAGDDTIFILMRTEKYAAALVRELGAVTKNNGEL